MTTATQPREASTMPITVVMINTGVGPIRVHAAGCRDIARDTCRGASVWEADVTSRRDMVIDAYDPDDFDYDPDSEWTSFDDLHVLPCVKL